MVHSVHTHTHVITTYLHTTTQWKRGKEVRGGEKGRERKGWEGRRGGKTGGNMGLGRA